ncbi:calcium-binding protein [Streptomyces sp. NPDC097981]|uniref:calcium-binding protein n=1 Tax=Streptomyces sp. NPDC097981 TaxID=3155428 RepID=UPI003316DC60
MSTTCTSTSTTAAPSTASTVGTVFHSAVRSGVRAGVAVAASLALVVVLPGVARAAPGDLDPSFGTGGKVVTDLSAFDDSQGMAVQSDGKVVTAGTSYAFEGPGDFAVVRYNADGSPDTGFGTDGVAVTDVGGGNDEAGGVAVQPDGKILVAGRSDLPDGTRGRFVLVRYNADGSLDTGFGSGGTAVTDFDPAGSSGADEVLVQADGRIVAAGFTRAGFALARFDPDGSPDPSFGTAGRVTTAFAAGGGRVHDLALQDDGRIVAAGDAGYTSPQYASDFALARYNTDGSLDTGFGTGGQVTASFTPGEDAAQGVAVQPDGRIVATGYANLDFALVRYTANGTPDPAFGTGGRVTTSSGRAYDVALQPDGKILAGGGSNGDLAVFRYQPDGSLDPGFGAGGRVTTDFGFDGWDEGRSVAVQADGRILASGVGGGDARVLARYLVAAAPPPPPSADLRVTKTGPAGVAIGDQATYTVTVTNTSTTTAATAVTLADTLTGPGSILSAAAGQGTCTTSATTASCPLGSLAPGASATVTVVAEPQATGTLSDTATADAAEADPVPGNDSATATTTVNNAHGCTVIGTSGADRLTGGAGNDVICGLGGNDTIVAGYGNDTVYAGSGNDTVDGGYGNDTLYAGPGNDSLTGNTGDDRLNTVDGVAGNDMANGGPGNDACTTDPGDTRIGCP